MHMGQGTQWWRHTPLSLNSHLQTRTIATHVEHTRDLHFAHHPELIVRLQGPPCGERSVIVLSPSISSSSTGQWQLRGEH